VQVAELYRKRWTIEARFYEVTQALDCEPNTLATRRPRCSRSVCPVASNAVALLRASLRLFMHRGVAELSNYYVR